MAASMIGRRELLRGAGVAATGAAVGVLGFATPAMASEGDHGESESVLGSWLVTRQDEGTPAPTMAVLSFAVGGVFLSHDIQPSSTPFSGTWAGNSSSFRATFWSGQTTGQPGQPGVTIRVHITNGHVSHGEISGSYVFDVFLPDGTEPPGQSGSGSFTGKRITA
ncbi:MAG: hypothetical protein ACRDV3_04910 [Acidothermaceae bacterium]